MYENISTPGVIVELDITERNIRNMVQGTAAYGIAHRPHVKTHRSSELAKLQIGLGAKGITCAKLGEAEMMARAGLHDILIAYPLIGEDKWRRYGDLHEECISLCTIINSSTGAEGLSNEAKKRGRIFDVLIEIDGGIQRGGISPAKDALAFAHSIQALRGIHISGLMHYPGTIYGETTLSGKESVARKERDDLLQTASLLAEAGFDMHILSGGNTVSSKLPHCLQGISEVRAGNYIFNDCAQLYPGVISVDDCALRIVATVVAITGENTAIIDAGSKTLSSDNFSPQTPRFGYVVGHEDLLLYALHEEHGFIKSPGKLPLAVGDKIAIVPNHACVVSNLAGQLIGMRNGAFDHIIQVDAQSCSI